MSRPIGPTRLLTAALSRTLVLVALGSQACQDPTSPQAGPPAPMVLAATVDTTVVNGATAVFGAKFLGWLPMSYRWQRDSVDIPGASGAFNTSAPDPFTFYTPSLDPVYSLTATMADSGVAFRVIISNSFGSDTSNAARLTVLVPPTITAEPAGLTVVTGTIYSLTVAATGSGPLVYRWQRNGLDLAGATTATLALPALPLDSGVAFRAIVSNAGGSDTSAAATLVVLSPPAITAQPVSQTVVSGTAFSMSVSATGTGPLSYQWQNNGTDMPGATSRTLGFPTLPVDSGAVYRVIVSNTAGSVTSAGAALTVLTPPAITVPPSSMAVANGAVANFGVTATGSGPLSYQWEVNAIAVPGIIGAGPSLALTTNPTNDGALVRVTVANTAGSVTSAAATLTVMVLPTITLDPVSQTVPNFTTVNFVVAATGSAPLSYQWQANGNDMAGFTSATLTVAAVAILNGTGFRAIVSNAHGADTSATATLTIANPPAITSQPASLTVVSGATAGFSVTATGDTPLSYQWQRNGTDIGGATSASYSLTAAPADNGALFAVVVSNAAGTVTSAGATLTVLVPPNITVPPLSLTVANGNNAAFSVTATGTAPLSYQWQRNGADISGAATASYTLLAAGAADNGALFRAIVTNAAGADTSAAATLTVITPLVTSASVAAGGTHSLGLKSDGTVWAWGGDGSGQLGNGLPMSDNPSPVQVSGLANVVQIAAGQNHSLALRSDGTVWAWGQGTLSQLGNGADLNSPTPVQVTGLSNVVRIAAGRYHSLAAKTDGTVWTWGTNSNGQLGDGSNTGSNIPVQVSIVIGTCVPVSPAVCPSGPDVQAMAAGWIHSLVQLSDLYAYGWGDNFRGEIGSGAGTGGSTSPIQIGALAGSHLLQLAAGNQYSLALLGDGTILQWGQAIGIGGSTTTPTPLGGLSGITQLAAGYEHALALKSDGTLWGWGRNDLGQLTGASSSYGNPHQVGFNSGAMLSGALQIGAGEIHTLVLKQDGTVWAFGDDHNCKLGRGCQGTTFSRDPVQVVGLKLF